MRTVIVVGAGASAEVNLPVGNKLTGIIADRLNFVFDRDIRKAGSPGIFEALKLGVARKDHRATDLNSLIRAARVIRDAMPLALSIDNFIHDHKENKAIELVGKLAIVESILEAERQSTIHISHSTREPKMEFASQKDIWFKAFSQRLIGHGSISDLRERLANITLVIFNYDRGVEHYLFHALKTYRDLSNEAAGNLVKSIQIFHPYGRVGDLPFIGDAKTVEFGYSCQSFELLQLADEIRTFTEGTDLHSSDVAILRQSLRNADQVVFLGFHFLPLNLDLLLPRPESQHTSARTYKAFATAKDFKVDDLAVIRQNISSRFSGHVGPFFMEDCTCAELFDRNKVTLAFD